jgi:hypothetical protein
LRKFTFGVEKAKIKKAPQASKNAGAETHPIRIRKRKRLHPAAYKSLISLVAGPRIELGTRGFSVRCSTG